MSDIESPFAADATLDPSLIDVAILDQASGLWQTAILAIGRRIATTVGDADQMVFDATSALAASFDFDLFGVVKPPTGGAPLSVSLNAVKSNVAAPPEPLILPERPEDSLVGFAMSAGRLIATPDLREETRYHDSILRRCQAQSALACPLRSSGVNYGSILLASLTPRGMMGNEFACVEIICHLVAAAEARSRTEQLLNQARVSVEALETVDASIVMLDAERRVRHMNRCCEELTGFFLGDVKQREFCSAFGASGEEATVHRLLDQVVSDGQPRQFEAQLVRKHGEARRVEWRFRRLTGDHACVLIGAGTDLTTKYELEQLVHKLRQEITSSSHEATSHESGTAGRSGAEQRRLPRRSFPYKQRMAPIRNGELPPLSEFAEIECRDISAGGFSYYCETEPLDVEIVVAFGVAGFETFMAARILHVRPTAHNGRAMFAIGCEYTGRREFKR